MAAALGWCFLLQRTECFRPHERLRRTSAAAMRAALRGEGAQERSGRPEPALVPCGGVAPRIFHLTHVDQGYNAEELREIFASSTG